MANKYVITEKDGGSENKFYYFPFSFPSWHLLSFIHWPTSKKHINNEWREYEIMHIPAFVKHEDWCQLKWE